MQHFKRKAEIMFYLRMQYGPNTIATLQHAAITFTSACETALAGLSTDISR